MKKYRLKNGEFDIESYLKDFRICCLHAMNETSTRHRKFKQYFNEPLTDDWPIGRRAQTREYNKNTRRILEYERKHPDILKKGI